jgi:hypothetical protein
LIKLPLFLQGNANCLSTCGLKIHLKGADMAKKTANGRTSKNKRSSKSSVQRSQKKRLEKRAGRPSVPDVFLDVPTLKIDEIKLSVGHLDAYVSLKAELADLVRLDVGANANLDDFELDIKGVEVQARLEVRLDEVSEIMQRALEAIENLPEILDSSMHLLSGERETKSVRRKPGRPGTGETVEVQRPGLLDTVDRTADHLLGQGGILGQGGAVSETLGQVGGAVGNIGQSVGQSVGDTVGSTAEGLLRHGGRDVTNSVRDVGRAVDGFEATRPIRGLFTHSEKKKGKRPSKKAKASLAKPRRTRSKSKVTH